MQATMHTTNRDGRTQASKQRGSFAVRAPNFPFKTARQIPTAISPQTFILLTITLQRPLQPLHTFPKNPHNNLGSRLHYECRITSIPTFLLQCHIYNRLSQHHNILSPLYNCRNCQLFNGHSPQPRRMLKE